MNYFERQQKIDEIFRGLIEKLESSGKAFVIRAKRINDDWVDNGDDDDIYFPTVFRILFEIKLPIPVVGDSEYTIRAYEFFTYDGDEKVATFNLDFSTHSYEYDLEEVTVDVIANNLVDFIDDKIKYNNWVNSVKDYQESVNAFTGDKRFELYNYQKDDESPKMACLDYSNPYSRVKLFSFDVAKFTDLKKIYEDIMRYSSFHGIDFSKK